MTPQVRARANPTSSWSESLQQQTRNAIEELPMTVDGHLHFKHPVLGYAYATVGELGRGRPCLYRKPGGEPLWFDAVDALLQAGWAID